VPHLAKKLFVGAREYVAIDRQLDSTRLLSNGLFIVSVCLAFKTKRLVFWAKA